MRGRLVTCAAFCLLLSVAAIAAEKPQIVIFTGNLSGVIDDCGCGDVPAGGIGRIATIIDSLRRSYPAALVLEAGDFLSSYPRKSNDLRVLSFYQLMHYTAVNPGGFEFTLGCEFLRRSVSIFSLPIVTANLGLSAISQPFLILKKNRQRIALIGLTDPEEFLYQETAQQPEKILPWKAALAGTLEKLRGRADEFIGLVHGGDEFVRQAAAEFPAGTLIVRGHWHREFDAARDGARAFQGRILANPGNGGEYVGLAAKRSGPGEVGTWQVELIRTDAAVRVSDEAVRQMQQIYQQALIDIQR